MATYIIGDVHGSYDALRRLLVKINFIPSKDKLIFVGDLINRGSQSLKVLRYVKSLGDSAETVLGNHDVTLIAYALGLPVQGDSFASIMAAPDADELIDWLRKRPLVLKVEDSNYYVVHAGISPDWEIDEVQQLAQETQFILQSDAAKKYLEIAYQKGPDRWNQCRTSTEKFRYTLNTLTRIRYLYQDKTLNFKEKGVYGQQDPQLVAWFDQLQFKNANIKIIFGHWAALGYMETPFFICIDSGLVWGGELTAIKLSSCGIKKYQVK